MSKSTLGRPGSTQVAKKEENGAFWGAFFDRFFDIFPSAHKARKRNTYITLGGFGPSKTSLFESHFRSLFVTLSGPSSGGAFCAFLARPGADLYTKGQFWTPFGTQKVTSGDE